MTLAVLAAAITRVMLVCGLIWFWFSWAFAGPESRSYGAWGNLGLAAIAFAVVVALSMR
jgi:hypothetical protein